MVADVPEVSKSKCDGTGDKCCISLALIVVKILLTWVGLGGLYEVHGWARGVAFMP